MSGRFGTPSLVLTGSALAVLAYPPFHLIVPSLVMLVPALVLIHRAAGESLPVTSAMKAGFWYGVVSQSFVLYWIPVALWRLNHAAIVAFVPMLLMFGIYHALVFSFVAWTRRTETIPLAVAFPAAWTAMEWLLAHQGMFSMPWLGLGTSLTGFPVLVQSADLFGARGMTFVLVAANVAVFQAIHRPRCGPRMMLALLFGIVIVTGYGVLRINTLEIIPVGTATLVQPAISVQEARDSTRRDSIVAGLLDISGRENLRARADLIIWPEAALGEAPAKHPDWIDGISALARRRGSTVITGVVERDAGGSFRNSVYAFTGSGADGYSSSYDKRFLVPLIERRSIVPIPLNPGFIPGIDSRPLDTPVGRAGFLVCFESAFERAARDARLSGAHFLINVSNDIWLTGTAGMIQHPAHLVMRAVETRAGIALASNTGYTGFVDPAGRFYGLRRGPGRAVVSGALLTAETRSVYMVLGDFVGPISIAIVLVATASGFRTSRMA